MDSAMRDLDRIEERDPQDGGGRKITVLFLAAVVTVSIVFGMGSLVDDGSKPTASEPDPLAALDHVDGLAPAEPAVIPSPEVDPQDLTFPEALVEDSRLDIAATVAAAAAEYDHPDPLNHPSAEAALSQAVARLLPAGAAAQDTDDVLARTLQHDRLVAESLPVQPQRRPAAATGREGPYTLQVISYRTPEEAEEFAATLRSRGHTAFVVSGDVPERGMHWRVRIGPFETQREAESYRGQFERDEQMNTFILRRP